MRTVKRISSEMLAQKMRELSPEFDVIQSGDMDVGGKKDVMSLLVRARAEYEKQQQKGSLEANEEGYGMNQEAMMDQVVRSLLSILSA